MMKRLFILLVGVITLILPGTVQAHFLATDGSIGAVLHIDPNDAPIANSQASFFFEFKDKENKFHPQNCNCTFKIIEGGKEISSQPLFQNTNNPTLSNASVFYTFPKRDVYTVKVIGKPLASKNFQPFTLSWNLRIDQENKSESSQIRSSSFFSEHIIHIILIILVVISFILYLFVSRQSNKKTKTKGGDKNEENYRNRY